MSRPQRNIKTTKTVVGLGLINCWEPPPTHAPPPQSPQTQNEMIEQK